MDGLTVLQVVSKSSFHGCLPGIPLCFTVNICASGLWVGVGELTAVTKLSNDVQVMQCSMGGQCEQGMGTKTPGLMPVYGNTPLSTAGRLVVSSWT